MTLMNRFIILPIRYSILSLLFSVCFFSCRQEEIEQDVVPSGEDLVDFTLEFPTRSVGKDMTESTLDPLSDYFTAEESILLIGQRTQNHSLTFDETNADGSQNDYLYKYVWDNKEANEAGGDSPNWTTGYNFKALESWKNPLTWSSVIGHGALGNSFAFGALYYPIDNSERTSVETDQSDIEGLKKSNILGTYHQTNSIYERFRFRLYHLMACIRVTILVPVQKTVEGKGVTGFDGDRKIDATMLKLIKDFTIDWGELPSDYPPYLMADESTGTPSDIKMYPHPVDAPREIKEWDISNFGLEGTDEVKEYTFTGLFPPQTLSKTNNILQFDIFAQNSSRNKDTSYVWSTSQLMANLKVTAGTITNLVLYFPREDNNAILVKSEILDWGKTDTTVTITPEIETTPES